MGSGLKSCGLRGWTPQPHQHRVNRAFPRAVNPVTRQKKRASMATVLDLVRGFIERLSPEPVCDDCIAARLRLSDTSLANKKTRELAGMGGFERMHHVCSLCGAPRKVIRRRVA